MYGRVRNRANAPGCHGADGPRVDFPVNRLPDMQLLGWDPIAERGEILAAAARWIAERAPGAVAVWR